MKVLIGVEQSQDHTLLSELYHFPWPGGTEFRVLSVAEKVHPSMLEVMGTTPADVQRKADLHASAAASAVTAGLQDAGFAAAPETVEGDPGAEIAADAKRWGADLVVIGAEVEGKLQRVLLGSFATAVVNHAECSVLVMRPAREAVPQTPSSE
jgi:nucleotide-binding universal stress UspA family protein